MPIRAVVYCRYSSAQQSERSIEDQLELCRIRLKQTPPHGIVQVQEGRGHGADDHQRTSGAPLWATTLIHHGSVRSFGRSGEILTGSSTDRFELLS